MLSLAFPSISTGTYGYPPELACPVAIDAVRSDLERHGGLERVVSCVFDDQDLDRCGRALARSSARPR